MKEIIDRIRAKTPKYWKRMFYAALFLNGVSGAVLISSREGFYFPEWMLGYASHAFWATFVVAAVARTAKEVEGGKE